MSVSSDSTSSPYPLDEWDLLDQSLPIVGSGSEVQPNPGPTVHECQNAPFILKEALEDVVESVPDLQYGLFGQVVASYSQGAIEAPQDSRLYMNCSAPFSAVICGVQGSGKSHTLSTMLENLLIPKCKALGSLDEPMSGLVLHYGEGGSSSLPSEVAWLSSSSRDLDIRLPKVRVFVSPSSINTLHSVYTSALGNNVDVQVLYFAESELDAQAFMSMMAVNSSDSAPLYMQMILSLLRKLGENFSYRAFERQLANIKSTFNPAQMAGLEQRMSLLTSFLHPNPAVAKRELSKRPRFAPGQLTIIDLSDPFIDSASACGIFNIMCRLFVRARLDAGKVLVIDEAHKYISNESGSSELTQRILSMIRQQRHLGMRVIISTQEPTILPPVIIDLCNVVVLHRFQSPAWWDHTVKRVSTDFSSADVFDQVVRLQTGQSIILVPSGIGKFKSVRASVRQVNGDASEAPSCNTLGLFGRRYLVCKTRRRLTDDGGASILAVSAPQEDSDSEG